VVQFRLSYGGAQPDTFVILRLQAEESHGQSSGWRDSSPALRSGSE